MVARVPALRPDAGIKLRAARAAIRMCFPPRGGRGLEWRRDLGRKDTVVRGLAIYQNHSLGMRQKMARALFLTPVAPDRFARQGSGIQRRFEMFAAAAAAVFDTIDFVVFVDTEDPATLRARREATLRELAKQLPIEHSVTLVSAMPPTGQDGFFHGQLAPIIDFARLPGFRNFLGPRPLEALSRCLEECRPTFVIAQRLTAMATLARIARRTALPPVFFDLDDLEHVVFRRTIKDPPMWASKRLAYLQLPAVIAEERRAIRLARHTFVCSDLDKSKLARLAMAERVVVLPNAVEIPPAAAALPPAQTLLFLGIFSYGPNRAAAEHFLDAIWPRIRARAPEAQAVFAGAYPERIRHHRAPPAGVQFPGYVADLDALYAEARVVICPIRSGGGTRVKIIEAAAHARPIVATTIGAEGLAFENNAEILVRDGDEDFATACVNLLGDLEACVTLGLKARARAHRDYRRDAVAAGLATLIRETLDPATS